MPENCNLPPVFPSGATDRQTADLVGDRSDEYAYTVKSYEDRNDSGITWSEPVGRTYIALKVLEEGNCSWKHVLIDEQNLKELPTRTSIAGGWGMPASSTIFWMPSAGYRVLLPDIDGDGRKEIQVITAWNNKPPTTLFISNVEEVVRQKLAVSGKDIAKDK